MWLSDVPLDANEGAFGDALLAVRFAAGDLAELTNYEWLEDGKPYREWLVPAALVNGRATVRVASDP